ncbi:MAG: RNA polymerase sigma factor RpoD/SigA [Patescibacteria group bacterium]
MKYKSEGFEFRRDLGDNNTQRYMQDIADSQPLSSEEEAVLAQRIKLGDHQARNKLTEANLRFVVSIALEYKNKGIPLGDLISAGNMGLITAAERFDETKGVRFISYAVWWVRQSILLTFAEDKGVVRLPLNKHDLIRAIYKFSDRKLTETEQSPTTEEIALGLRQSISSVRDAINASQPTVFMDAAGDDERNLHEILADPNQESPGAIHRRMTLARELKQALDSLRDERESEVIRLYFGLDDNEPKTLEEIGAGFGLTRERIRQIKEKALRKLRHSARARFSKWMPGERNNDFLLEHLTLPP